jgi:hypothetical protein
MDTKGIGALAAALVLLPVGIVLVRLAWRQRSGRWRMPAGWLLIAAGLAAWIKTLGAELGTAYWLLAFSAVAFAVIAANLELRSAPARAGREVALEPEERPTNWRRAIAKSFLAFVLAGVAAIGIGVAFAVSMPLATTDRIVIGGLMVPVLWGAGMAWTLSDAKVLRATLLLTLISALAYGIAFLPKVMGA